MICCILMYYEGDVRLTIYYCLMNQRDIFEKAYVDLTDSIFRYIYYRVFDRDIAKDLTQETFYKVWDYLAKGKTIDNIKAFTYRTAHNIVVNSIRNKKHALSLEELDETIGFEVSDTIQDELKIKAQDIASIFDSFKILKDKDAELMKLRYIDGLSIEEISKVTSYSENNISVKLHRLIEKLKEYHKEI
jgi:RNA polymerase sigma-70 factor, ECF subfamily